MVQNVVGDASLNRFEVDGICVRLNLIHVDGQCDPNNDPYKFGAADSMICYDVNTSFFDYWHLQKQAIQANVAHLFTAVGGPVSGGGGCSSALLNQYAGFTATSVEKMTWNHVFGQSDLFAHEVAHNLGM